MSDEMLTRYLLRGLALDNPYDHEYGECLWCERGARRGGPDDPLGPRPHDEDCPWLLARRLLGLPT